MSLAAWPVARMAFVAVRFILDMEALGRESDAQLFRVLRVGFVGLAAAAFLLTLIIVAVKRLHDRDKSAWWLAIFYGVPLLLDSAAYAVGANLALIFVAPAALINLWALIEFGLLRGSLGPNRFGDDPTGIALPPPLPAG